MKTRTMSTRWVPAFFALLALLTVSATAQPVPREEPASNDFSSMTPEKWDVFTGRIIQALRSDHPGLQEGALRMIIRYGDHVDVCRTRQDVLKLYRQGKNDNLRRMAVVVISKMHDRAALQRLRRDFAHEKSPCVRHTMGFVLLEAGLATRSTEEPSPVRPEKMIASDTEMIE